MLIELESFETIRQFDLRLERHFFSDEDFGLYFEDEISFIGEVRKIGEDGAAVKGKICGAARLECARCTKPMPFEMKLDVDADFLPSGLFVSGPNHELKDRDFASDILLEGKIDLKNLAREQILISLPQHFLCSNDCLGLCQKCGTDLNEKKCDCTDEEIDPRWSQLKKLIGN